MRVHGGESRERAHLFADLRDGTGRLQIFLKEGDVDAETLDRTQRLARESTVQVTGIVAEKRPPKVPEGALPPTAYEVLAREVKVLAEAVAPLPLGVTDEVAISRPGWIIDSSTSAAPTSMRCSDSARRSLNSVAGTSSRRASVRRTHRRSSPQRRKEGRTSSQ